jgi:hypothetical protein
MSDHSSPQPTAHQPSEPLAPLYGKLPPGWECWTGVGGILYARRRKTSPPVVLRSADAEDLARQVREHEGRQR